MEKFKRIKDYENIISLLLHTPLDFIINYPIKVQHFLKLKYQNGLKMFQPELLIKEEH